MDIKVGCCYEILVGQHNGELGIVIEVVGNLGCEDTYKLLTLEGDTHIYTRNQIQHPVSRSADNYPDCKCGIAMRIWNLDPARYEFRQNWLSQNVPAIFEEVGKTQDEEGMPEYILRCKDCGNEIRIPVG